MAVIVTVRSEVVREWGRMGDNPLTATRSNLVLDVASGELNVLGRYRNLNIYGGLGQIGIISL